MTAGRTYAIELRGLTLAYGSRTLIEGADARFGRGEFTALVGRNGTGKSTLLRTIAGLVRPAAGEVIVDGRPLVAMHPREKASLISFVSTDGVRVANLKVADVVALGRTPYTDWTGRLTSDDRARVVRSLELVGMLDFSDKAVDTLSDGERQRVMIARALAQDTPIILLDEPTAFLDLPNRYEICLLLGNLARSEGKSVVFSTHDLSVALELCDTMAIIERGRVVHGTVRALVESGDVQRIFAGTPLRFDPQTNSVKLE